MKTLIFISALVSVKIASAQVNFQYLDANNVKAGIGNRGLIHYNPVNSRPSCEAPVGSGKHSNSATSLWIGGYDMSGQLHLAAQTYRQWGDDFWPGPIDTLTGNITASASLQYDKIWKINKTDIDSFSVNFANGRVQSGQYMPSNNILTWPAHGTGGQARNLAPFVDVNGNGIYDPLTGGDYPKIKGTQMLFWIYNDNLNHTNTGGIPLIVEIHGSAYAFGTPGQPAFLDNATFYSYKIYNRSNNIYTGMYLSLRVDADLGYYGDDVVGCHIPGDYGYIYNADNFDEGNGGYGNVTPASGFKVLKSPYNVEDGIDNDRDEFTDEPCEQLGMSAFNYCNNSFAGVPISQTDPVVPLEYYRYMNSKWKDGTPFTCGGNAYGGLTPAEYVFPDAGYQSINCNLPMWKDSLTYINNDRRYLISSGPYTMPKGATCEVEYVHCTSFPNINTAIQQLDTDLTLLQQFYNLTAVDDCALLNGISEMDKHSAKISPNPVYDTFSITMSENMNTSFEITICDVAGQIVFQKQFSSGNNISVGLKPDITNGVYIMLARNLTNGIIYTQKLVVQK